MTKLHVLVCAAAALGAAPFCARGQAIDPSITYQGELLSGAAAATGPVDLRFRLYSATSGGSQVGPQLTRVGQALDSGRFTVQLDFGTTAFTGEARWLEIDVRNAGAGTYTTLSPRQQVMAAPVAVAALKPWTISGSDAYFTGGRIGVGEQFPMAPLHVTNIHRDFAPSALAQDDIVLEDTDAILGLISDGGGVAGSGVTLKQIDGAGMLLDNWSMYRGTSGAGSELYFTYGPDARYAINPPMLIVTPKGDVWLRGEIRTPTRTHRKVIPTHDFGYTPSTMRGGDGQIHPADDFSGATTTSIELPAGARLTQIRAIVQDGTSTGAVRISLYSLGFGERIATRETFVETSTSEITGLATIQRLTSVVIQEDRSYLLRYVFTGTSPRLSRAAWEVELTYETTAIR